MSHRDKIMHCYYIGDLANIAEPEMFFKVAVHTQERND